LKILSLAQAPKALVKAGAASPHHAFIQIRNQVNNWKNHDITNPDVLEFIRMQKELLSSDEKITCTWHGAAKPHLLVRQIQPFRLHKHLRCLTYGCPFGTPIGHVRRFAPHCAWIKKHPERVVKYYFHILKYLEQHTETKKFTLAPISKIKRHFIRIDVVVLFNLLKNSKLIDMTLKDFKAEKDLQFSLVFKYKPENFSYIIDSTSICFHYQKIQTSHSAARSAAHEGEKVEFALQAGAASPHRASSGHPELPGATPVRVKRIIGIDPGRVNLIFAAEKINGKTKMYRLTKKCYYNSSGMTKARKRNAKW
jgi:hypothetical protein